MIRSGRFDRATELGVGIAAGFGCLVALIAGWGAGHTEIPAMKQVAPEKWELPEPPPNNVVKYHQFLKSRTPWSAELASGNNALASSDASTSKSPSAWRLAGIVRRGRDHFALIAVGVGASAKIEYKSVGDTLPDGSIITDITAEHILGNDSSSSGAGSEAHIFHLSDSKM